MAFNALTFLVARTVAQQRGVSAQEASRLGVLGAMLKPPALGVVMASVIASNETPTPQAAPPPVIPPVKVPDVTTATTGKGSEHASLVLWEQGLAVKINGLGRRNAAPVESQSPAPGTDVLPGTAVTLTVSPGGSIP
jgi:hypothetical protein